MVIIAEKWFQLGNRLFVMAHLIAAAKEKGWTVANPAFEDYSDYFAVTRDDRLCRYPPRRARMCRWRWMAGLVAWSLATASRWVLKCHMATRLLRTVAIGLHGECRLDAEPFMSWAERTFGLVLIGWQFRAPVWFDRHAEVIRQYFRPTPELCARVEEVVAQARRNCEILVGVHIRQGDYKEHLGGRYFYETAEYVGFMRHIEQLYHGRRIGFLICSNAPQDPRAFEGLCWTAGEGHLVSDLYSLARCDLLVGPPSTFSQWASFYGQVPLYIIRDPSETPSVERFAVFHGGMSHL